MKIAKIIRRFGLKIVEKRYHPSNKPSLVGEYCNSLLILGYVGAETWAWYCTECKEVGQSRESRLRDNKCRCECDPLIHKGAIKHGAYSSAATKKAMLAYNKMLSCGIPVAKRWLSKDGFTNFIKDLGPTPVGHILYIHPLAERCNSRTVRWVDNSLKLYQKYPLTFNSYRAMLDRCNRQIGYLHLTICDRWLYGEGNKLPFTCFFEDMGERPDKEHSIDRINGKKGYNPKNCRWADTKTQRLNQLTRVNKVHCKGEILTIQDIADRAGLSWSQVKWRLSKGMRPSSIIKNAHTEAA